MSHSIHDLIRVLPRLWLPGVQVIPLDKAWPWEDWSHQSSRLQISHVALPWPSLSTAPFLHSSRLGHHISKWGTSGEAARSSCWESTEAAWGISALPGDHPPFQFLLAPSVLQAMKVSRISCSCPKRWKDVAAERVAWRVGSGCPFLRGSSWADYEAQAKINTALCSSGLGQSRGNKVWRVISQKPLNREWNPILHQICLSSQGEDQIICKDMVGKK